MIDTLRVTLEDESLVAETKVKLTDDDGDDVEIEVFVDEAELVIAPRWPLANGAEHHLIIDRACGSDIVAFTTDEPVEVRLPRAEEFPVSRAEAPDQGEGALP